LNFIVKGDSLKAMADIILKHVCSRIFTMNSILLKNLFTDHLSLQLLEQTRWLIKLSLQAVLVGDLASNFIKWQKEYNPERYHHLADINIIDIILILDSEYFAWVLFQI
jgi:hypothetical protein